MGRENKNVIRSPEYWKAVNDTLPENSLNKIITELQGIVLKSRMFGKAADQCAELTKEQLKLKSAEGVQLIVSLVYRIDFMSVISESYDGFSALMHTKRGTNASLKSFETRFSAAVSEFNSFSSTTNLPQCVTSFILLKNSSIEHSKRVSAL